MIEEPTSPNLALSILSQVQLAVAHVVSRQQIVRFSVSVSSCAIQHPHKPMSERPMCTQANNSRSMLSKTVRALIASLLILSTASTQAQMLHVDGEEFLVNGINIPWRHFGQDFGASIRQLNYDSTFFNRTFEELQDNGVNCIRMWIHCDGRHSPIAGKDGIVRGLPRNFLDDLDDFFGRAARYNLMVLPVLWTFEMVDKGNIEIIRDPEKTQLYIDQALIPILERTRHHCNILAWEVINEPEWAMDIPFAGTTQQLVESQEMQRFVGQLAQAIHTHSPHKVTVGSAGLRFITDMHLFSNNYWHDVNLQSQNTHCSGAYLDFYSVHYYKWKLETLSPFRQPLTAMGLSKPVLLSEFSLAKRRDPEELMRLAIDNGYAGIMPWSMMANDGLARWDNFRDPLRDMSIEHADKMHVPSDCLAKDLDDYYASCLVYPNPAYDLLVIEHNQPSVSAVKVVITSWDGRQVLVRAMLDGGPIQFDISALAGGMYIVQVSALGPDGNIRVANRQKFMVAR